jgi:hypothetical protein
VLAAYNGPTELLQITQLIMDGESGPDEIKQDGLVCFKKGISKAQLTNCRDHGLFSFLFE